MDTPKKATENVVVCITATPGVVDNVSHEDWLWTQKLSKLCSVRSFERVHLGVGSREANKQTKKSASTKNLNYWHDIKNGNK